MRKYKGVIAAFALTITGAAGAQVYGNAPPGYGNHYNPHDTVVCESQDGRFHRCGVPWRDARIVQQLSQSACVRGRTWGIDRGSIWVNNGCRARFAAANGGGWRPPQGWDRRFEVKCGSPQYHYAFCQVDVGRQGRVTVRRQTSSTACIEGRSWGWNRAGIWVDRGCSAVFAIDRRW
jgi:hypothetical protein